MAEVSSQTLHIVARELASELNEARAALETFGDQQENVALLRKCNEHLHSVHGALRLAEVYGAALLAEEMCQVAGYLIDNFSEKRHLAEGLDALMRAMVQLPTYLERVLSGGRDMALVLLPLLNDLRAVRGHALLSEGTLLLLNLSSDKQANPAPAGPGETPQSVSQWARKLRPRYQLGLLGWIKGERVVQNLETLSRAAEKLEQVATTQPVFQLWWVVGAVLEALRDEGLEGSASVKRLLGQADRDMKRLYEQGEARYAESPSLELLNNLLYYVARARSSGPRVSAVRASFRLNELLPIDDDVEQARESLSAPSVKLMKTVAAAIKEDLSRVKDALDIFVRQGGTQVDELGPQLELLKKIADTLGVLGLGELRDKVQAETNDLQAIVAQRTAADEGTLLKMAATLIKVEDSLDEQLVGMIVPSAQEAGADAAPKPTAVEDIEFRQVTEAVLRECIVNMARIKEAIALSVEKPREAQAIDQIPQLMRGITAGLLMLGKTRAVEVMEGIDRALQQFVRSDGMTLPAEAVDRLADAIVAIEYYMETLQAGRADPWYMLDNAEVCIRFLAEAELVPRSEATSSAAAEYAHTVVIEPLSQTVASPTEHGRTAVLESASAVAPSPASAKPAVPAVADREIDPEFLELFIEEAKDEIERLRKLFPLWDENPQDQDSLVSVRRSFHTLKGSGRMVGAQLIGEFAWAIENLLNRVINKTLDRTPDMMAMLREAVAAVPELVEQLETAREPRIDVAKIINRAHAMAGFRPPAPAAAPARPPAPPPSAASSSTTQTVVAQTVVAPAPAPAEKKTAAATLDPGLREIYVKETADHLATIREFIAECTLASAPYPVTERLHRSCHTLSGTAKTAAVQPGIGIAEPLNRYVRKLYDNSVGLPEQGLEALQSSAEAIQQVVDCIEGDTAATFDHAPTIARLGELETELDQEIARLAEAVEATMATPVLTEEATGTPDASAEDTESATNVFAEDVFGSAATDADTGDDVIELPPTDPSSLELLDLSFLGTPSDTAASADDTAIAEGGPVDAETVQEDIVLSADGDTTDDVFVDEAMRSQEPSEPDADTAIHRAPPEPPVLDAEVPSPTAAPIIEDEIELAEAYEMCGDEAGEDSVSADDGLTVENITLGGTEPELSVPEIEPESEPETKAEPEPRSVPEPMTSAATVEPAPVALPATAAAPPPPQVEPLEEEADEFDPDVAAIFTEEAAELLETADSSLAAWARDRSNSALVFELKRVLHTLKGGARMAGIRAMGDLSHELESLMELVEAGQVQGDQAVFDGLQASLDELNRMRDAVSQGNRCAPARELIARIRSLAGHAPAASEAPAPAPARPAVAEQVPGPAPERAASIQPHVSVSEPTQPEPEMAEDSASTTGVVPTLTEIEMIAEPDAVAEREEDEIEIEFDADELGAAAPREAVRVEDTPPASVESGSAAMDVAALSPELPPDSSEEPAAAPEPQIPALPPGREPQAQERQEFARVDAELLDTLLNNAGEVSIFRSRLEQQVTSIEFNLAELGRTVTRLKEQMRKLEMETEAQILHRHQEEHPNRSDFDPLELDRYSTIQQLTRAFAESVSDVGSIEGLLENLTREAQNLLLQQSRVVTELQNGLMRTRMVPFQRHVQRLSRLVRQVATDTGKRAELVVVGASGELDRQVLDRMLPPFEHMLRNSVVHGIETPQERAAAGKPESGTIRVGLHREGSEMVIVLEDDGRGIDVNAVRARAKQRGLLQPGRVLTDEEAMQLILEPGFSTASSLTQHAGRGVGMDVVVTEIKKLGGALFTESTPGRGVKFTIRLPFTLAITQALIVRTGDELYALPLPTVEGVARVPRSEVQKHLAEDAASFNYGGQVYRFQHLGAFIGGVPSVLPEADVSMPVILIRAGEHSTAVVTDELVGSREMVVKSVGPQVASIRGISGATILGDGRIVIILDMGALVRSEWRARTPLEASPAPEKRTFALVVDDSITVRRVTQRLLERNGMKVMTAKDGVDALSILQEHVPDVILLDIEMPRMDGYELAQHVRADNRLAHIPIVMITSRVGEKHRARAIELGVNDYLGKPYQENQLLDAIEPLVEARRERA